MRKKNFRNTMFTVAIVTVAIAGISILSANDVNSLKYNNHDSGIELRSELLNINSNNNTAINSSGDSKYNEEKDSTAMSKSKADESKCAEKKADSKCEKK